MKKRITAFALTLVLIIGTLSTGVMAATQTEVDTEITSTATYLQTQLPTSLITIEEFEEVIMFIQANLNKDEYVKAFLASVRSENLSADGKLLWNGTENPKAYAAVLLVLAKAGIDATNFDGFNLVANFETCLNSYADTTALKTAINEAYLLQPIMFAIQGYSGKFSDANSAMLKIKDVILSYYETDLTFGFKLASYPGYPSADDCGSMLLALKFFYGTDPDVKTKVDASIEYIKSLLNGNNIIESWNVPSPEATAHALAVLKTYGDPLADSVYTGLMTIKDSDPIGSYSTPYDQVYASSEAFKGLGTYSKMLSSSLTMWDITAYTAIITPEVTISTATVNIAPRTADNSKLFIFTIIAVLSASTIIYIARKKIVQ